MLPRWIAITSILFVVGCAGCRSEKPQESPQSTELTRPVNETVIPTEEPLVLTVPNAMRDQHENLLKLFSKTAQAHLVELPSSHAALIRPCKMGDVLYLFPSNQDNEWYAAGADPRGKPEGFIRADDVFVTTHQERMRVRCETATIRKPIEVFQSLERLRERLESGPVAAPADWIEADFDLAARELPAVPLKEIRDIEIGSTSFRVMKVLLLTWNPHYGSLAFQAQPVSVPEGQSAEDLRQQLRRVDLLIVADATGSMQNIWDGLRRFLNGIVQSLIDGRSLDVQVSVVAYRDHHDSSWLNQHLPLTSDWNKAAGWLQKIDADQGGNWEEAVFDALQRGITKTAWRPGSFRFAVLAANSSGHEPGTPGNPNNLSLETIGSQARQEGIRIACLQCPYGRTVEDREAVLTKQMSEIAFLTGGIHIRIEPNSEVSPKSLMEYVRGVCRDQGRQVQEQIRIFDGLVSGKTAEAIKKEWNIPAPVFERRYHDLTQRLSLHPDSTKIQVADLGEIGFEAGWTVYSPDAWELCVMIREEALQTLITLCDRILTIGAERPDRLLDAYKTTLLALLGEDLIDFDRTLDADLKARGIPLRPDSLLAFSTIELVSMPLESRRQLVKALEKRYGVLVETAATTEPDKFGNVIIPARCLP